LSNKKLNLALVWPRKKEWQISYSPGQWMGSAEGENKKHISFKGIHNKWKHRIWQKGTRNNS